MTAQRYKALTEGLQERILVLDGAMGTMLMALELSERDFRGKRFVDHACDLQGNLDLLSLTQPQHISDIHRSYLTAGADIISTNTFSSAAGAQSVYRAEALAYELNFESAKLARIAADEFSRREIAKPRFVAGVMGPGLIDVDLCKQSATYEEAARGLLDGGADILLLETAYDTSNTEAALQGISGLLKRRIDKPPLWVSSCVAKVNNLTLAGQTIGDFWRSVKQTTPFCVGFNCSVGAEEVRPHIETLSVLADSLVAVYPSAGLSNDCGILTDTPEQMAHTLREFAVAGLVNIVGGCCGTTPEYIAAISNSVAEIEPRRPGTLRL